MWCHLCRRQGSPMKETLMEERNQHSQVEEEDGDVDDDEDDDEDDEDDEGELALWSPEVHVLELQKERDRGLGFSILDYQVTTSIYPSCKGLCILKSKEET